MNQLPTSVVPSYPSNDLNFWRDWFASFNIVIQSLISTPLWTGVIVASIVLQAFQIPFVGSFVSLVQMIAGLFILAIIIRNTYCTIVPGAAGRTELFPQSIELKMFGVNFLIGLGTMFLFWFFIIPAIWFAVIHALALEFVVLENCGVMEAMSKSRQLMKGNIWRLIGYTWAWPIAINIGILIVFGIIGATAYFTMGIDKSEAAQSLFKNIFMAGLMAVCLPLGYTIRSLAARAFVAFMHDAGQTTAVEQQMQSIKSTDF